MATAANSRAGTGRVGTGRVGTGRAGWVEFTEDHSGTEAEHQTGPRHSICSTASFWSAQSEHSSVSMGASSCDLPSLSAEEAANEDAAHLQMPNPSVPEDEDVDMDSISWGSGAKQTNGQSDAAKQTNGQSDAANRFTAWVTFDDDEQKATASLPRPGRPAHVRLDNGGRFQDANSNVNRPPSWNDNRTQNGGCERHLLDLSPGGLPNDTPYSKKNPFFDEEFSDIKPSPINPFSSYFHDGQDLGTKQDVGTKQEAKSHVQSNGTSKDNSPYFFTFSSPPLLSQDPRVERESISLFSSESDQRPDVGGSKAAVCDDRLDLEPLRNLQICDPDDPGSPTLPDDTLEEEEEGEEGEEEAAADSYEPEHMAAREGWAMLLRIPEKKNIMSSRHWGPIYVRLAPEGVLQLFYEKGLDKPFRTLRLDPRHEVSEHRLQSYEETGRVHTISVELVQYREKRRMQPKSPVTHQLVRDQLVKLATTCYHDYLSFRHALVELMRRLPADAGGAACATPPATPPATPTGGEEELQVEVRDEFYGTVGGGDGRVLEQLVLTRVHALAFLSGFPLCQLGLNDVQVRGKEVVSRRDIVPSSSARWIRPRACELHRDHADQPAFLASRAVVFRPPPARRFELLRFRTAFGEKSLPFTLRTVASVRGAEVTVQSWMLLSSGFSSNRDPLNLIPCENLAVRYPIPEIWAKNFRREGVMGEKSLKARFNKGASFGTASASGSEPAMRVTLGTAKYEQAFQAVVWRVSRLPDKNSALGHPHTFFCRLELGSDREVPEYLQRHLEVEFDMPAASASKAAVRSLSVGDRPDAKKWINYKSHYFYQVPIEQKYEVAGGTPTDQPGECAQQ